MRIGLLDHMGYGNLGDAATQDAVIANIRKRVPDAELVGFSLIPSDTLQRHGIPSYPILRWHPTPEKIENPIAGESIGFKSSLKRGLKSNPFIYTWAKPVLEFAREVASWAHSYKRLRSLDLLIISGGGQLGELWHGPWSHPYTIFKFSLLAKLARKKLYFLNVGAGPLVNPLSQFFVRHAVRFADYLSFRDEDSRELVRSLGVKQEMHVYPDCVYALEVKDYTSRRPNGTAMPIVGLNPIGFCDPRIWPRKDTAAYGEYLEKVAHFSAWLIEQGYILRMFTTEISVDRYALEDIEALLRSKLSSPELLCGVFLPASESVNDTLREMLEFDYIVSSKFHGIIFSQMLAKPVISLSYHKKMDVAMRAAGQSRFCADVKGFDVNWLKNAFRLLVDERASIELNSATVVEVNAAKLSQQFDALFLPDQPQLNTKSTSLPSLKEFDGIETPMSCEEDAVHRG